MKKIILVTAFAALLTAPAFAKPIDRKTQRDNLVDTYAMLDVARVHCGIPDFDVKMLYKQFAYQLKSDGFNPDAMREEAYAKHHRWLNKIPLACTRTQIGINELRDAIMEIKAEAEAKMRAKQAGSAK